MSNEPTAQYERPAIAKIGSVHELTLGTIPIKDPSKTGDAYVPGVGFVSATGVHTST